MDAVGLQFLALILNTQSTMELKKKLRLSTTDLKVMGVTRDVIMNSSSTLSDLKRWGYSTQDLKEMGLSDTDIESLS